MTLSVHIGPVPDLNDRDSFSMSLIL